VDLGNYVQTSDANGIVVITQMHPMSVIFVLPEDNLPPILQQLHAGQTLTTTAYDRSQTTKLATGVLATLDNQVDTATGTIKFRAMFDNKDELLFPNQFVNIQLLVQTIHNALIIPVAAVQRGSPGTFVYLVKPDSTVTVQKVTLGVTQGEQVAITDGLQAGDQVVTDGADKLKEGSKVILPGAKPDDGKVEKKDGASGDHQGHKHGKQ
jgi:multidrug efflux system membrane fusion protein